MARVTKSTLKGYFQKGSIPSQTEFESLIDTTAAPTSTSVDYGTGVQGTGDTYQLDIAELNGEKITTVIMDLQGLSGSAADNGIIGISGSDSSYLLKWDTAIHGNLYKVDLGCGETLAGSVNDVDLAFSASIQSTFATVTQSNAVILTSDSARDSGEFKTTSTITGVPSTDDYIYMTNGTSGTAGIYTAGKLIIKFYGI
jgi:hypothetical protein